MDDLFRAVTEGKPLYGDYTTWLHARNRNGDSLLHVAARNGRLYAVWVLLHTHPSLAAEPNNQLQLPEDVACSSASYERCRAGRLQIYRQHEAL